MAIFPWFFLRIYFSELRFFPCKKSRRTYIVDRRANNGPSKRRADGPNGKGKHAMKMKEITVQTTVKDENGKPKKDEQGKDMKETWKIQVAEFDATDIAVTLSDAAKAQKVTPESVLSNFNRQWQTDAANDSRRERTSDAPKKVAVDGMLKVLMGLGMTQEQAEAKIAEARKA